MVNLEYMIFEVFIIVFAVLALIPVFKNWKESRNKMYIAIFTYTIGMIGYSLINLFTYLYEIDTNIFLIGTLRFGHILGYMLITIQFLFILYLRGVTKFYTLPLVVAFYLILGHMLNATTMIFVIYAMIVSFTPAYILLRDGKRKRNGLAFGMGLLFLIWGIGQAIPVILITEIFRVIAIVFFFLGTKGYYEKYIFINQEEEQKILGTWIAKLVVKK